MSRTCSDRRNPACLHIAQLSDAKESSRGDHSKSKKTHLIIRTTLQSKFEGFSPLCIISFYSRHYCNTKGYAIPSKSPEELFQRVPGL